MANGPGSPNIGQVSTFRVRPRSFLRPGVAVRGRRLRLLRLQPTKAVAMCLAFSARNARFHSPFTLSRPLTPKRRKPIASLDQPCEDSAIQFRRAQRPRPLGLAIGPAIGPTIRRLDRQHSPSISVCFRHHVPAPHRPNSALVRRGQLVPAAVAEIVASTAPATAHEGRNPGNVAVDPSLVRGVRWPREIPGKASSDTAVASRMKYVLGPDPDSRVAVAGHRCLGRGFGLNWLGDMVFADTGCATRSQRHSAVRNRQ